MVSVFSRTFVVCVFLAVPSLAFAEDKALGTTTDQKNLIAGLCSTQLDLPPAGCTCVAERSLTELDDNQRAYLILSVVQPQAAEKMPIAQSKEELAAVFKFLEAANTACKSDAAAPAEGGTTQQ